MRRNFTRTFALAVVVAAIAAPNASAGIGKVSMQDFNGVQKAPTTQSTSFRGGVNVATGDLNGDGGGYMEYKLTDLIISS